MKYEITKSDMKPKINKAGAENPGLTGLERDESLAIDSEIAFPIASKNPVCARACAFVCTRVCVVRACQSSRGRAGPVANKEA